MNTDIPWADLLPHGIVHIVAPWKSVHPNFVAGDQGMYQMGYAVQGVLDRDEVVAWIQFNSDYTRDEALKNMGCLHVKQVPKFHFESCRSIYEFTDLWRDLNHRFSPHLWVLYNPWETPYIPGGSMRPEVWEDTLSSMMVSGTVIAFNRIAPGKQSRDFPALKPWCLAEHQQSFMDSLWSMEFTVDKNPCQIWVPEEHRYNRDIISGIIQEHYAYMMGFTNDGNIEVWDPHSQTGPNPTLIDLKAWRANREQN